jgi:hypothetical protein
MTATIQRETDGAFLLRLSGTVQRTEFGYVQDTTARDIDAGAGFRKAPGRFFPAGQAWLAEE